MQGFAIFAAWTKSLIDVQSLYFPHEKFIFLENVEVVFFVVLEFYGLVEWTTMF